MSSQHTDNLRDVAPRELRQRMPEDVVDLVEQAGGQAWRQGRIGPSRIPTDEFFNHHPR